MKLNNHPIFILSCSLFVCARGCAWVCVLGLRVGYVPQHHLVNKLTFLYCIIRVLLSKNTCICVDLFLAFLSYFIDLCFSSNTVMFWLLLLFSRVWSQRVWYILYYFHLGVLGYLKSFMVLYKFYSCSVFLKMSLGLG